MSGLRAVLPGQVLVKLAICLFALALCFGALVLPRRQAITELDREIAATREIIQRQDKLFPLYASINAELGGIDMSAFPEAVGSPLPLERVSFLSTLLTEQARAFGVDCLAVTPAADSQDAEAGTLDARCQFLGDLEDLRDLLISMGGLEYLRGAKAMRFRNQGGKTLCDVTVLVALAEAERRTAQAGEPR